MMNFWLGLDVAWQIGFIGVLGFLWGPIINWSIYNLAYFPRPISPWRRNRFRESVDKDHQLATIIVNTSTFSLKHFPIIGWLAVRHEAPFHGALFWLRPFCIELFWPIFLAWLFWYEVSGNLLPALALPPVNAIQPSLHVQFLAHSILCFFMCIATFVDFDERTIPDWITIPGTFCGLVGATCFSNWHLWTSATDLNTNAWPSTLHYDSPWNDLALTGTKGLLVGLGCFTVWCFALADRRLILRRGWRKAIAFFLACLVRFPTWKVLLGVWLAGSVALVCVWFLLSPLGQQSLLSSLVGMVLGGLTVWMVRWIAGLAIGVEALGFGDVTLMAMVGAFVGWQPTSIAFFISPMIALAFVLLRYMVTGDNQTPFGPYLCAGVLVTILAWENVWNNYCQSMLMVMGPFLAQLLVAALLLMGGLLWIWRMIKQLVFTAHHENKKC